MTVCPWGSSRGISLVALWCYPLRSSDRLCKAAMKETQACNKRMQRYEI